MVGMGVKILYLPNQYSQQRQRQKPVDIYPVRLAMEATKDMDDGHEVHWGFRVLKYHKTPFGVLPIPPTDWSFKYDEIVTTPRYSDFLSLPIPDRVFTDAFNRMYQKYGNYKFHPATHMQVADGCWHGKCTFCVESKNKWQIRSVSSAMQEISECHRLGFKEIFDDSGTFPDKEWMNEFLSWKEFDDFHEIVMGCNMRIGADVDFRAMKVMGNFRMVLFGIESANQSTLDRIKKGIKADEIIPTIKRASDAGLHPHLTVMFGQPGESEEEELRTLDLVHYLLRKGYAKTAQASLYRVDGYEPIDRGNVNRIYNVAVYPEFWYHQIKSVKDIASLKYLLKCIRKGIVRD